MSSKTKKRIAILISIIFLITAYTTAVYNAYLPMVIYQVTLTPTLTPTPTLRPAIHIIKILNDPESPLDEYVEIKNTKNNDVEMDEWILRDEGNKDGTKNTYTFQDFVLRKGKTVKVWTKSGSNDSSNLYWGEKVEIWNKGSDCAWLRDEENELVTNYCYNK